VTGGETAPGDRLRRLEAVTDAGLAHLDVDELLDELLERVRELLNADTAAVLLLNPNARYLVATAARGIEEEVRQGVRIPLGKGFAGRIAAEKEPVILDRVDHSNVLNPILRDKGIHSMLGVPLLVGGTVLGVLHVGTLGPRRFTADDTALLQLVADRIALAVHARAAQVERTAASTLQRSLLPPALPEIPGLEFAARYVPGGQGQVGGDWYDVFTLPSGAVCVVVGDVVGRGLPAAVDMAWLRHALRAYTLETADPADILDRLNRQVRHFEPGVMATVLCAVVDPLGEQMRLSTAGHPPPMISVGTGPPAAILDLPADVPIGVTSDGRRHTSTVALPPGTAVCLYTDGLVERRRRSLTVGLERLAQAMFAGPVSSRSARRSCRSWSDPTRRPTTSPCSCCAACPCSRPTATGSSWSCRPRRARSSRCASRCAGGSSTSRPGGRPPRTCSPPSARRAPTRSSTPTGPPAAPCRSA
jgi:serine phosphatase RsbU (regulator of sigma subunit)